jgi:hypothetical protein
VEVGRVAQHGKGDLEGGERQHQDALDRRGVNGHPGGAQPAVEQDLGEQPAEGVAHDDRRLVQIADDGVVVVDDLGHAQLGNP